MNHHNAPSSSRASCPCKKLPLCLSSFTAAEYGDLHSLSKLGSAVANRRDEFGYTPLHLAAQNNHVAATALLMQLGCPVNGGGVVGATPLHRAAFSGATASMRVLLESTECNLLAKDSSFGDQMTPLHKAAAGGRYLAVQLLLEALQQKDNEAFADRNAGSMSIRNINISALSHERSFESKLSLALKAKDKWNRTPLGVALELRQIQDDERQSVARWDAVAGGVADWNKCVELLTKAEQQQQQQHQQKANAKKEPKLLCRPLPNHLLLLVKDGCINCMGEQGSGQCLTASWQQDFQVTLGNCVEVSLRKRVKPLQPDATKTWERCDGDGGDAHGSDTALKCTTQVKAREVHPVEEFSQGGSSCSNCGNISIALYPTNGGHLICKACKRKSPCIR